jgi:hypothetical protein
MKLTEKQKHQIETARREAEAVLNELKRQTLKGKDLTRMKAIEEAVVDLETALLL